MQRLILNMPHLRLLLLLALSISMLGMAIARKDRSRKRNKKAMPVHHDSDPTAKKRSVLGMVLVWF